MKKNQKDVYRLHTMGVLNSDNLVVNIRRRGVWVIGGSDEVVDFSEAYCQECMEHSAKKDPRGLKMVEARRTGLSAIVCTEKSRYNRLCEMQGVLGNDIPIIDENDSESPGIDPVLMWQLVVEGRKKK